MTRIWTTSSDVQELDRQIRLHFADSPTLYVSWTSERNSGGPDSERYSIASGGTWIRSGSDCTYVYSLGRDIVGLSETLPTAVPSITGSQGETSV